MYSRLNCVYISRGLACVVQVFSKPCGRCRRPIAYTNAPKTHKHIVKTTLGHAASDSQEVLQYFAKSENQFVFGYLLFGYKPTLMGLESKAEADSNTA